MNTEALEPIRQVYLRLAHLDSILSNTEHAQPPYSYAAHLLWCAVKDAIAIEKANIHKTENPQAANAGENEASKC